MANTQQRSLQRQTNLIEFYSHPTSCLEQHQATKKQSMWDSLLSHTHTDALKMWICCNWRQKEQYEWTLTLSVSVNVHLLQVCSHSFLQIKRAKQLPAKVDIWSWLYRRSEYHRWRNPLSEMVGHRAAWSQFHPRGRSQLLSESQWSLPLPSLVLHNWS